MPMRAEPGIQQRTSTPRAQASRVVVGLAGAIVLGAAPAIAWDLSTQAPRAAERRPSEPASPSPWRTAGKHVKAAVGGIARVYLPLPQDAPVASENPPASPVPARPPPRLSASVAPARMAPYIIE
jgi:hypothetical protein